MKRLCQSINHVNKIDMEKEFVPYNLSLRMKQLGFDEPCVAHWFNNVGIGIEFRLEPLNEAIAKTNISVYYELAPLYQQAFRWFREKYSMYHQIHKGYGWEGIVRESNNNESILWHDGTYNSPEEAELACLEKLIEIVEEKQKEL
jgi:hypothetical protein